MSTYYEGKLLVAPPSMRDWRFKKSVVYLWKHDIAGATGIIINKQLESPTFRDICEESDIELDEGIDAPIYYGGPINMEIVGCLHTLDYRVDSTNVFDTELGFTMDRKCITDIAHGRGPAQYIVTMGMASWMSGQLETELEALPPRSRHESWLVMDFDPNIVWHSNQREMWNACVNIAVHEQSLNYVDRFFKNQ
jgi:putative transcriptional regulator